MVLIADLVSLGKYADVNDNFDDFLAIPKDMLLDGLKAFEFKEGAETLTLVHIGRISKAEYGPFGET